MQEVNTELIRQRMVDLGLSGYRIEKLTANPHVYPIQMKQSNLSKVLKAEGTRRPSRELLKTLGLILEVPWKQLLID